MESNSKAKCKQISRESLSDVLECSVCLEQLTFDHKVLPCQHTFCKPCLQKIYARNGCLKCPECRLIFQQNIDSLPYNIILVRILSCFDKQPATFRQPYHQKLPGWKFRGPIQNHCMHKIASDSKQSVFSNGILNAAFQDKPLPLIGKNMQPLPPSQHKSPSSTATSSTSSLQPLCHAKYDLCMSNDQEDGCLTFKKDDIIFVRRRIDKNWAEGKLNDKIGIFPIAFVEMNTHAKMLMKYSINVQSNSTDVSSENQLSPDHNSRLPYLYVALFAYKPMKVDELELRKGHMYLVAEKCHDGWYKGQSLRTLNWGMFPGTHVVRISSESNMLIKSHLHQITNPRNAIQGQILPLNVNGKNMANSKPPCLPPRGLNRLKVPLTKSHMDHVNVGNTFSIDNPVFEDNLMSVQSPVHVRSGSCPDQSSQNHRKFNLPNGFENGVSRNLFHVKSGSFDLNR